MASLVGEWLAVFPERGRVQGGECHCTPGGHQQATAVKEKIRTGLTLTIIQGLKNLM